MSLGDILQPNYPNPNAVVYPEHIPYRGPVPGGVHEGKLIEIKGHVPYGADVFTVNLLTGFDPHSDRPLHLSVRFQHHVVVRNTLQNNCWGAEEKHGLFPFTTGKDFTMLILVEPSAYRIAVNSQHCWEYSHKIPFSRVSSIFIEGSVQVERIEFVDKITPYQRPGTCIPSIPAYPPVGPRGHLIPSLPSVYPPSGGIQPAVCPAFPSTGIVPPPENQIGVCPMPPSGFQPSSNLAPVYNPSIPYAYPIYGGLKHGMMIYISGRPSASPYKFTINLQSGTSTYPPPDIAFHFDVRFFNFTVVRNTRYNNAWAAEEVTVSHFPFQPAVNFDMIIKIESDRYMVAINGQHFMEFRHRLTPLSRFDTLYIENDIVVSSIRFA